MRPLPTPEIGERFGRLTVTGVGLHAGPARAAGVRCDCGNERVVAVSALRSGVRVSCGCRRPSLGTPEDLVGRRFGMVTVVRAYRADRYLRADVRCDCGVEKAGLYAHNLKTLASCGCVVRKRREESPVVGRRYGRLVVVERLQSKPPIYRVVCDCGNERVVHYNNMHNGRTRSCGCYARDVMRENPPGRTHGATGTPEHRTWLAMLSRCYSTGAPCFDSYGGRGIYVCARWRNDFAAFLADMGPRPQGRYSIDRINNDGSYTCGRCGECLAKGAPSNCRWADLQTQARNTRRNIWITIGGVHRLAADVCREHGVSKQTFSNRLAAGWTRKAAATTPPDPARVARGRALRNAALARRTEAA